MPLWNGGFVFYVDVWAFFNRPAVGLFELRNISQLVRGRTMCASTRVVILRQHRTIPALRLKHRFGGCGTASALPKCSIMSGCSTRIVLRGQKPLALCEPLPLLRFAVSATGGAHLCSIQYYLRFWLGICRTSLAVSALRMIRYCLENPGSQAGDRPFPTDALARHNKIIGCSAIIKVLTKALTPKLFVQERLKNPP